MGHSFENWWFKVKTTLQTLILHHCEGTLWLTMRCHTRTALQQKINVIQVLKPCAHSTQFHDDVIKWKHFPRYWPFVRGFYRSPGKPAKGQWLGALMFSLICAWINGWVNNREAGDLRHHRAHYYVTVIWCGICVLTNVQVYSYMYGVRVCAYNYVVFNNFVITTYPVFW